MNLAKLIHDAVKSYNEQVDEDRVSYRGTYSGRGMYGRDCVGISGRQEDCMQVISMVIGDAWDGTPPDSDFDFRGMVDTLLGFEQDSMGLGSILYWRDVVQATGDEEEDDEEALFVEDGIGITGA